MKTIVKTKQNQRVFYLQDQPRDIRLLEKPAMNFFLCWMMILRILLRDASMTLQLK